MQVWEAYVVFTIWLSSIFVLSPAVDAAREMRGDPPVFPAITAILPTNGFGLVLVAVIYAATIAAILTWSVCRLRRILPGRSVWLPTMLIIVSVMAFWLLCAR